MEGGRRRRRGLRRDLGTNEWSGRKRATSSRKQRWRNRRVAFTVDCGLWREEDGLKNHEKQQTIRSAPPMDGDDTHTFGGAELRRRKKQRALLARETGTKAPPNLFIIPSTLVVDSCLATRLGPPSLDPSVNGKPRFFQDGSPSRVPTWWGNVGFKFLRRRGGGGWLFRPDNTGPAACRSCTVSAERTPVSATTRHGARTARVVRRRPMAGEPDMHS